MKNWIINIFFKDFKAEWIKVASIDAFKKAREDVEATFEGDVEARAKELSDDMISSLLTPIDWRRVVTLNKQQGIVYINGERADDKRLQNLKNEAQMLVTFDLWGLLYETPKALAEKAMFVSGESLDDMKKGRAMLFTLSSQKEIINLFTAIPNKPKPGSGGNPGNSV